MGGDREEHEAGVATSRGSGSAESTVTDELGRMLARVSDAIVGLDREWRYTYVNSQAAALLGRTREDLLGKHIWTEFPEGVGQPFHRAYERAMAEQQAVAFEDHFAPWDRWFENRVYPAADGLSIFFHDITARKRAEQAERDRHEFSRQIIASASEGIAVLDRELRVVQLNAALASMIQMAPEAVIGKRLGEFLPAEAAAASEARLRRALAGEVIETVDRRTPRFLSGQATYVSTISCPMRDDSGAIVGVITFARDVSDRIDAEAALRASEQRLRLALGAARAGVWDWDLRSGDIVWSREHEQLWGMAPGSFRGTYEEFTAPLHPDDRDHVELRLQHAIDEHSRYTAEFRLQLPDGTQRWIAGSGQTVDSEDGAVVRVLGTVVDVTERKRAETLLHCQTRVLEMIASGGSLTETLEALARGAEAQTSGMLCSILLLDDAGMHLRHAAAPSLPREYVEAIDGAAIGDNAGSCGTAAFTAEPVHVHDIAVDPRWENYRALALPHGLRACWSTPLFDHRRRVLGTFALYYRQPGKPQPWHERLIAMATRVAEVALEHDRSRAQLAASEQRYYDLYEHAPNMYLSIDAKTRAIVECNATLTRVTGYARSDLIGRDVFALYDPAVADRMSQVFSEFGRVGEIRDVETRIRAKDGTVLDISINATAVRGPDGSVVRSRSIWRDITRQRRADGELRELSARLLRSQDDERRRIARELHDTTGQNLAALGLNLAMLQRRAATPEVSGLLEECVALIELSAGELRTLSYLLHPPLLEDFGLERALGELVHGFARRSGLAVTVDVPTPVTRLTDDIELALFRVAQESLANVRRHSGSATASVRLVATSDEVVLEIRDQGHGSSDGTFVAGVGIAGMRERLRHLGGQLQIERGAGGTCVRAIAPIAEPPP